MNIGWVVNIWFWRRGGMAYGTEDSPREFLRILGYRVQVVEFVSPDATARNILLRAEYGVKSGQPQPVSEYLDLRDAWGVSPWLETRLSGILSKHLSRYGC